MHFRDSSQGVPIFQCPMFQRIVASKCERFPFSGGLGCTATQHQVAPVELCGMLGVAVGPLQITARRSEQPASVSAVPRDPRLPRKATWFLFPCAFPEISGKAGPSTGSPRGFSGAKRRKSLTTCFPRRKNKVNMFSFGRSIFYNSSTIFLYNIPTHSSMP